MNCRKVKGYFIHQFHLHFCITINVIKSSLFPMKFNIIRVRNHIHSEVKLEILQIKSKQNVDGLLFINVKNT